MTFQVRDRAVGKNPKQICHSFGLDVVNWVFLGRVSNAFDLQKFTVIMDKKEMLLIIPIAQTPTACGWALNERRECKPTRRLLGAIYS